MEEIAEIPKKFPKPVHFQFCYVCKTSISTDEVTFHRIPKKKGILDSEWVKVLAENNISARNSTLICSEHFEASCFTQKKVDNTLSKRRKLLMGSLPTILTPQRKKLSSKVFSPNTNSEENNDKNENLNDNDISAVNYDVETITENLDISNSAETATENLEISNAVNSELSQKINDVKLNSPVRNSVTSQEQHEKTPAITLDFTITTCNKSPRLTITKNNDIIDILQATFEEDVQERVTNDKEYKALITIKSDSESNFQIFDEVIMEKINDLLFNSNSDINQEESELIDDDIQEVTELSKGTSTYLKKTKKAKDLNSIPNGNHQIENSVNHNDETIEEVNLEKEVPKNRKPGPKNYGPKSSKKKKRKIEEITLDDELSKVSKSFSADEEVLDLEPYLNGASKIKKKKSEISNSDIEIDQKRDSVVKEIDIDEFKKKPMLILKKLNIEHQDPGKLVWGRFQGVWYPALTLNANDVGQFDFAGKVWVLWIGSTRISELDLENDVKPFIEHLHTMLDNRPPKKKVLGDKIYEAVFKLIQSKFDLGLPKKPYSNWIKFKLQYYMNKSDQFVFHPYPTEINNILFNLKKKNQTAITKYYKQNIKS